MKKIFLLLLLLVVSVSASARKSYITLLSHSYSGSSYTSYMSGDVPNDIQGFIYDSYGHYWYTEEDADLSAGEILNLLSQYGYEVESMSTGLNVANTSSRVQYLLSKEIPSGNQTEIVGDVNNDSEVTVADVNAVVNIILGLAKSNPSIMKQLKEQLK